MYRWTCSKTPEVFEDIDKITQKNFFCNNFRKPKHTALNGNSGRCSGGNLWRTGLPQKIGLKTICYWNGKL